MEQPYDPELVADIDDIFLGHWPTDLTAIFTRSYEPGALVAYAYRDGGAHLPQDDA